MKRFLVSILVPASAAIAVVGSGFSVWYFGGKEVKTDTSANLEIENLLQVGSFTQKLDSLMLKFDQTQAGRNQAVTGEDELKGLEATGITFSGKVTTVTYTSPTKPVVDKGTFGNDAVKTQIKSVVKIDSELANWLTVKTENGVTSETDGFTITWADSDAATRSLDLATVFSFEYAKAGNQYASLSDDKKADRTDFATCEPLNANEYKVMSGALSKMNGKISIVTTATIVKVQA